MTARQPSDAAQRRAAINPAQSFLVQAPAGSGKTELLTDRILALLALVNRPEEIVAITFTRKAAAEMQARVLGKLQAAAGPCPPEPHLQQSWELARKAMERDEQMGWNLLHYPARLSIRTIDAFCAALVRNMPWLSSMGGMPAVAESARPLYEAAAMATLAMVDDFDPVARFIEHMDVDLRTASALLVDMLGSRDQWLPLLQESDDAQVLEDNLYEAVEADLALLPGLMPPGWSHQLAPLADAAAQELFEANTLDDTFVAADGPPGIIDLAGWDGSPFSTDFSAVRDWQALADLLLTSGNVLRKTANKKQGFGPKTQHKDAFVEWLKAQDPDAPWVAALAATRRLPAGGYQPAQLEVLRDLLQTLRLAAAQLRVVFSENAQVDFIEVAQSALHALGHADSPSDLLLSLDLSIKHLLIDEFQDTSHTQIRLLERITSGWEPGDGRSLFLVGDPMQSIYRFRKAEVAWFLRVQAEGLGEVPLTALKLHENFRSQAGVVDWVNATFERLFPAQSNPDEGAISYTASVAFNAKEPQLGVTLWPVYQFDNKGKKSDGQPLADLPPERLPLGPPAEELIVERVRAALKRQPQSDKPVGILVRGRSHLGEVVRKLSQAGIACRAVELDSLKDRQPVVDLVQLARALSHPGDRLAWLSVLRSPLCGLTLNSLHALTGQHHQRTVPSLLREAVNNKTDVLKGLPAAETQRLRHAASVLLSQANASGQAPFAAWLENCWQRLGGPLVYTSAADRSDIERTLRLVETLAPYGGLDPAQLEAELEGLYAASDSTGPAVEIMTIHKAKGLEFDTVILMGLHHRAPADKPPMVAFEHQNGRLLLGPVKARAEGQQDPVSHYLAEREKTRIRHEVDRLLYVAATRARQQLDLIVELVIKDDDKKGLHLADPASNSLLARLWPFIQTPALPEPVQERGLAGVLELAQQGRAAQLAAASLSGLTGLANTESPDSLAGQATGTAITASASSAAQRALIEPTDAVVAGEANISQTGATDIVAANTTQAGATDTAAANTTQAGATDTAAANTSQTGATDIAAANTTQAGATDIVAANTTQARSTDSASVMPSAVIRPLLRLPDAQIKQLAARFAAPGVPALAPGPAATGEEPSWQWSSHLGHEAVIGTVAHAWLERIGRDGPQHWPLERVQEALPLIKKQLARAGLPQNELPAASQALQDTLLATLNSKTGQWLLSAARAHREWTLLDASGRVSVIDLAIADEDGWLIVDYKTGVPAEDEPRDVFEQRMLQRYSEQLQRYCQQVHALDNRPARGALYFPRIDCWIDVPV